jgi:hypothetical protein
VLAAIGDISFGELVLAILVGVLLSLGVFSHATKHGNRHATAWGVVVFLLPAAVIGYFAYYFLTRRR